MSLVSQLNLVFQRIATEVKAKAPLTRSIATANGLQGGGNLSADRTLSPVYGSAVNTVCQGNDSRLSDARTPTTHSHSISEVTSLQTTLDGKQTLNSNLTTIAGLTNADDNVLQRKSGAWASRTMAQLRPDIRVPWESELYLNSSAIAASYTGYSDNDGGIIVGAAAGIVLEQVIWRLSAPAAVIGGTGNFQIEWFMGSSTAAETTLIQTTQIAAGQHDVIVSFSPVQTCTVNTVLRAKITSGTATLPSKSTVQWRGYFL